MRIHRVDIEGFGPFRAKQTVDLDTYAGDGIFLISGRTGTGKSSILDAVCFALYGSTPRYDDTEKRLRSDHAAPDDPTQVAVEFTVDDRTWRIERSPEYQRPKLRGEGMTTAAAKVEMFERVDDAWVGRAARAVDVGHLVDEIVGLNQQQFLQVILLAQGRFARFLLAKNDDRQRLLRTLFGTRRFRDYETALDDRRRVAQSGLDEQTQTLRAILDHAQPDIDRAEQTAESAGSTAFGAAGAEEAAAPPAEGARTEPAPADVAQSPVPGPGLPSADDWPARIARLRAAAALADAEAERRAADTAAARATRDAAETARDAQRALRDHQTRRDAARTSLAQLDARADAIRAQRDELDAARRAESVRSHLAAVQAADADHEAAARTARADHDAWNAALDGARATRAEREAPETFALPGVDAEPGALDEFAADMQRRLGEWNPVRELETHLAQKSDLIDTRRGEHRDVSTRLEALDAKRAALPARRASLDDAIAKAAQRAVRRETVARHIEALEAQFAAVRDIERLAAAYAAAADQARAAAERSAASDAHLARLHEQRIAGMSGELAAQLAPGDACSVCGSTEHPAPAPLADGHVTPEAIDEAQAGADAARAASQAAADARGRADVELRDAQNRAGGRTELAISGDLLSARTEHDDAQTAAAEQKDLERQRDDLASAETSLAAEIEKSLAEQAALAQRIESDEAALADDRRRVAEAAGPFDSVAERIGAVQKLASRATAAADAARAAAHAREARQRAHDALDAALVDSAFSAVDDAREALRDRAAQQGLETALGEADTARRVAEQALADAAAHDLPDEPIDLEPLERALVDARASADAAVARHTDARALADSLASAATRADTAHETVADRAAHAAVISRLADTVAGRPPNSKRMNLETFVLAAELEEIVEAANTRLHQMSNGRYALQHTDALARRGAASGLGIDVLDRFTNQARPPQSLSGGETFLASLALALGLAEVVTGRAGGIRLDTLFIDEGFGSLDADTLDVAMHTLDELRQGGRTIGLISHVEAMKDQIPAQLRVRQTAEGWSVVEQ